MYFGLSETQKLLQESVSRFGRGQCAPAALRLPAGFAKIQSDFDLLGMGGIMIPDEFGGQAGSLLDLAVIQMALGHFVAPIQFIGNAALLPIALLNNSDKSYFTPLIAGDLNCAIALEENGVSFENGKLNGVKNMGFDIISATHILTNVDSKLFLTPITEVEIILSGTIDTTRQFAKIIFANAAATKLSAVKPVLAVAHIMLAADMVGAAEAMIAQAVAYAKIRQQFGRVIASFQAVKHLCADMVARLEPCRAMLWLAAHNFETAPDEFVKTAFLTKAHISEVTRFVARAAIEIFGGMGFTDEANLHFWFKRIGVNYQLLGAPDNLLAKAADITLN